jgi:hypothetical protein
MGPNHGKWEDFLSQIIERYTSGKDFREDAMVIEEFVGIIRSMLAYRMDARPTMSVLLARMTKLFTA